jgi:patatin-like phospholipase/acyl hydrolase
MPPPPAVAAAPTPQIQTQGGNNPSTQLAQTIGGAMKPVRAYVVSQDIQSQTALDRKTNRAATFSGG